LIKYRLTVPLTDHCHTWLHMAALPVKAAVTQLTEGSTGQQLAGALTITSNICYTFPLFKDFDLVSPIRKHTTNMAHTNNQQGVILQMSVQLLAPNNIPNMAI